MYLLDSNVLIEASRTYYSATLAPAFWSWVAGQHSAGNLASITAVRKEIDDGKGSGHLKSWAASLPASFWMSPTGPTVTAMTTVTSWVIDPVRPYNIAATHEFLGVADYLLIAECLGGGHVLVTRERSAPQAKKRVFIPDVCGGVGVRVSDPFTVYEELGLRFP